MKTLQSLHEKGTARVIQGGRVHHGWVEVYYRPVALPEMAASRVRQPTSWIVYSRV